MPSALRTTVEKVATTGVATLNRARARIMNEPSWHNGGMQFWIDGAHINSQPTEASPFTDDIVHDLAKGLSSTWGMTVPNCVDYAGNGWDFTPSSALAAAGASTRLDVPTDVTTDVWGDGTVNQHFGIVLYLRMPAFADWNPSANILPFVNFDNQANYLNAPAMAIIGQVTGGALKNIQAVRPVSTTSRDIINLTVPTAAFNKFSQLAFWRDSTGVHLSLRYDEGSEEGAVARSNSSTLSNATNDFSAIGGRIGTRNGYVSFSTSSTGWKWKLYAAGVENLRTSGRDFDAVLLSDWAWRLRMHRDGIYL